MQEISESVIRRIQKLFALGNDKANEHEAAAAMGKAQELLAAYNLEMADVQGKQVAGGPRQPEKRGEQKVNRSAMYTWQQQLVACIAEANFCWYWVLETHETYRKRGETWDSYRKVKRHKILGSEANTTVVTMMVDYLFETIERILPYDNRDRLSKSAISWRRGCSDRLIERIKAKAEAMKTADYAKDGEAAYSTAIQLRSIADKEYALNYDARYGEGAWARRLAADAEYKAGELVRQEQYAAAQAALAKQRAAETPAERARREKAEAIEAEKNRKYWERQAAAEQKRRRDAINSIDHSAYYAGQKVGATINLDSQLKANSNKGDLN